MGQGQGTRVVWAGAVNGRMFWSDGNTRCRYMGINWDGAGIAAAGIDHNPLTNANPQLDALYETHIVHQYETFKNFRSAGIRIGNNQQIPTGEVTFDNCLFQNCANGVALLQYNDYNNVITACEFRNCGIAVNCPYGGFYARDLHFEHSGTADFFLSAHPNTIRRCTSVGSAQFIVLPGSGDADPVLIEGCVVDGWTSPAGAINSAKRGPLVIFDCQFLNPPSAFPPIYLNNPPQLLQAIVTCNDTFAGSSNLFAHREVWSEYAIPNGQLSGGVSSSDISFFQSQATVPSRVFNVMDFGAKGDNLTDDTRAISNCIVAARNFGQGAIAYLPATRYRVTGTIPISGTNYFVGGNGYATCVRWDGPATGTVFEVREPHDITIEQLSIEAANTACRVHQANSSGSSSVTYDDIYVNPASESTNVVRGLELAELPSGATVLGRLFSGSVTVSNCSAATVLFDVLWDGVFRVAGPTAPKTGFLGLLTHSSGNNLYDLIVHDNQDVVIGDFYVDSTIHHAWLGGDGVASNGRVTIAGSKVNTLPNQTMTINNYQGRLSYFTAGFWYQTPTIVSQSGAQPFSLLFVGNAFYETPPLFNFGALGQPILIQNLVNVTGAALATSVVLDAVPSGGAQVAAAALDDFRQLGQVDLLLNYHRVSPPYILGIAPAGQ